MQSFLAIHFRLRVTNSNRHGHSMWRQRRQEHIWMGIFPLFHIICLVPVAYIHLHIYTNMFQWYLVKERGRKIGLWCLIGFNRCKNIFLWISKYFENLVDWFKSRKKISKLLKIWCKFPLYSICIIDSFFFI